MFQVWQREIVTSSADCAFIETTQDMAAVAQLLSHIQLTGRGYFQSHTLASKIPAYVPACGYSTLHGFRFIFVKSHVFLVSSVF